MKTYQEHIQLMSKEKIYRLFDFAINRKKVSKNIKEKIAFLLSGIEENYIYYDYLENCYKVISVSSIKKKIKKEYTVFFNSNTKRSIKKCIGYDEQQEKYDEKIYENSGWNCDCQNHALNLVECSHILTAKIYKIALEKCNYDIKNTQELIIDYALGLFK